MKRSLKSVLCELGCYAVAFSPTITGVAAVSASAPFLAFAIEHINEISVRMDELIEEVKNNEEFIEIVNSEKENLTAKWINKQIGDAEFRKQVNELSSGTFIIETAKAILPEVYTEYNDCKNDLLKKSLSEMLPSVIGTCVGASLIIDQGLFFLDDTKKWINKGKTYAGKTSTATEQEIEYDASKLSEAFDGFDEPYDASIELEEHRHDGEPKAENSKEIQPGNEQ